MNTEHLIISEHFMKTFRQMSEIELVTNSKKFLNVSNSIKNKKVIEERKINQFSLYGSAFTTVYRVKISYTILYNYITGKMIKL